MVLDSSGFGNDETTAEDEAAARQLVTAGIRHLGQFPNPQLASEAMLTGASGDVADAMSDPELAPYLGANPDGHGQRHGPDNGPGQPGSNVYAWNQAEYEKVRRPLLWNHPGWESFGDMPILNLGWMDTVRRGDPNTIRKWQGLLQDRGYYSDHRDHQSGRWDAGADEAAFREFMLSYAMPTALWGKDTTGRNQAKAFMQALGADPDHISHLQTQDPDFGRDVAIRWLQAQGHDNQLDSLHEFVDRFGGEHLPANWQQVAEGGGLGEKLLETGASLLKLQLLPLTLGEKIFGQHHIQDAINKVDPAQRRQEELSSLLTANDKEMLAPTLNQIGHSEGFLPFSWWDRQKAHVALAIGYAFGDVAAGRPISNPMDPASDAGKRIHENEDDLAGALFGKQWAKDHSAAAELANVVANTVDDPLVWFTGPAVRAPKLASDLMRAVRAGRKGEVETVDSLGGLRSAVSPTVAQALQKFISPRRYMERAHSEALFNVRDDEPMVHELLGIDDEMIHEDAHPKVRERMRSSVQRVREAQSPEEVRQVLNENFRHVFHTHAGLVNRMQAMQSLTPVVADRMGAGWLTKHRTMGGFMADSHDLSLDQKMAVSRYIEQQLHIVGHEPRTIRKAVNEFFALPQGQRQFWIGSELPKLLDEGPALVAKQVSTDAVRQWHDRLQRGSYDAAVDRALGPVQGVRQATYAPAQRGKTDPTTGAPIEAGTELSRVPRDFPEETRGVLDGLDRAMKARQYEFRTFLDGEAKELMKAEPALTITEAIERARQSEVVRRHQTQLDAELAELTAQAHEIAPLGATRPGPLFTSQLSRRATFKVSSYELASYLSRGMHAHEAIASAARADSFYRVWKPITLMRPSTAARVTIGDDIIRFALALATEFHAPLSAVRLLAQSVVKAYAAAGQNVGRGVRSMAQDVAGRLRGQTQMERQAAALARSEKAGEGIADRARAEMVDSKTLQTMTLMKQISETDHHVMVPYEPGVEGYERGYATWFSTLARAPEVREFAKAFQKGGYSAGRQAVRQQLQRRFPPNAELLEAQKQDLDTLADMQSEYLADQMRHPEMVRWYTEGAIDSEKAGKLYKAHRDLFPVIAAPRDTMHSRNLVSRALARVPAAMYHAILEPMIATARAEGARAMHERYHRQLVDTYGRGSDWSEEEMRATARAQTYGWMRNNVYQGQRTIMGRAMRHTFPFWGATANMNRFFLRQAQLHPRGIVPGLRLMNAAEMQADQQKGPSGIGGNILEALGFSGGDALSLTPAHALFFTSDGLGSLVPGFGPIYSPVLSFVDHDQALKDTLSQIPGLREQLGYQEGSGGHPLIGFVEQAASAVGLISPWHKPFTVPFIGGDQETYRRRIDAQVRKLYVDYQEGRRDHPPTEEEAAASLGSEMLTSTTLGSLVPMLPKVRNQRDEEIRVASDEMRQATTPADRQQVVANHQAIAPLLQYHDPSTSQPVRDQLVRDHPWLAPYVTSMYSTTGTRPSTLAEYDAAIASGDLHVLGVDREFVPAIRKHAEFAAAWSAYKPLQDAEETYRRLHGVSTSDPDYRQWVAEHIAPRVQALMEQYPDWQEQFLKERRKDLPGLEATTAPIRALATWEVIPTHPGLENQKSLAWRAALVRVNDAATALREARANGDGREREDEILAAFNRKLDEIAKTSEEFALELSRFGHSKFDDLVSYDVAAARAAEEAQGG